MSKQPYRLDMDSDVLLGRSELLTEVINWLTQEHPDHVSLVGPRCIGKSAVARYFARDLAWSAGVYRGVAYLDLRLHTPRTDKEFVELLAMNLRNAVAPHSTVAADIEPTSPDLVDILPPALDILRSEGIRVLVVLDGCDAVVTRPGITENLWHNLREWGQSGTLRFLTTSRARLSDLCCDPKSQASDFWRNFHDPPRQVGPYDDSDWRNVLQPLEQFGGSLNDSGRKEIANWTGGHPALVSLLCARLCVTAQQQQKKIDQALVNQAAEEVLESKSDWLRALWRDCPAPVQAHLAAVATRSVKRQELADEHLEFGVARGYWRAEGGTVKSTCRLMERHAKANGSDAREVHQFFGTAERFAENIRAVLGARLSQIKLADTDLKRQAERWLQELPGDPAAAIMPARVIVTRALRLVFKAESPSNQVPADWLRKWEDAGANIAKITPGALPSALGKLTWVLREAVGTTDVPRLTRFATKETAALIDFLKTIGDYAQHPDESSPVQIGLAVTGAFAVVELIEHLARDFAPKD